MKANKTAQNLTTGVNTKGEQTSPFGHVVESMGGIIDTALCSGKFVNLDSLLIQLEQVKGDISQRRRLPQNVDRTTMTAMKIKPHLQWLCRAGGLNRAVSVFGEKQGKYRHGVAKHLATQLLDEIKGLQGV